MSSKHREEYNIVNDRNKLNKSDELTETNDENDLNISNNSDCPDNNNKSQKTSSSKFTYLQTQCVNLVTVHGRPFSLMDDQAFKNIIAMTAISPRESQTLNSHSIKKIISEKAEIVRKDIAKGVKGRLISLKIDSATRLDRTFFAVNVQYIENASVVIKTLGVTEMWDRSTSDYLREKLLYILRKYQINVDQIFTITSDNGANMLKLTRSMNDILKGDISDDEDSDPECSDQLLDINFQSDDDVPYEITTVRCAAHSLQLAIQDALKEDESLPIIEHARWIVRKLRTPTMKNFIKSAKKNKAILDNNTRWHSTFDMLERLKTLKDFCSEVSGEALYCSHTFWDATDDLLSSLRPAKMCTKKLQEEQLTLSDFFHVWTKCYLDTSHVQTPLAQQICLFMKNRQQILMTNPTLLSALYLDPRFQVVLSSEEEALAVQHLNVTWRRILKIQAKYLNINQESEENVSLPSTSLAADENDEIELMLAQTEREKRHEQRVRYINTRADIVNTLQNFSNHARLPPKEKILTFWKEKALLEPQLYLLSQVVFAVPATQVSVERLFSSLKFVLNDLRYNLNENIVDDVLVIRNNK